MVEIINHNSWTDIQNYERPPAIIKTAESLWVSPKTWNLVFDTRNWVATILIKGETKKETVELNESLKKEFIQKLKQLPNYQWSKVQEAIEKWTIEIKKILNRDIYAIYESKTWNLIYLTLLNGEQYNNVHHFRDKDLLWDMIYWWFIKQWYKWIKLDTKTWLRRLYKENWKEVPIFSDEYATATLNAINYLRQSVRDFEEEYEKRQKLKRR